MSMVLLANTILSQSSATDKERFDLCIAMLKGYYDALEGRVGTSIGFFVVVIGWLITSQGARDAIAKRGWFLGSALGMLTATLVFYGLNIAHWVNRWREILAYTEALGYMEPRFYARYELPSWAFMAYFTPVALLYAFVVLCLILIATGRFK